MEEMEDEKRKALSKMIYLRTETKNKRISNMSLLHPYFHSYNKFSKFMAIGYLIHSINPINFHIQIPSNRLIFDCGCSFEPELLGGLEHEFYSFHILGGISSSQLTFIFFRGVGIPPTRVNSLLLFVQIPM